MTLQAFFKINFKNPNKYLKENYDWVTFVLQCFSSCLNMVPCLLCVIVVLVASASARGKACGLFFFYLKLFLLSLLSFGHPILSFFLFVFRILKPLPSESKRSDKVPILKKCLASAVIFIYNTCKYLTITLYAALVIQVQIIRKIKLQNLSSEAAN